MIAVPYGIPGSFRHANHVCSKATFEQRLRSSTIRQNCRSLQQTGFTAIVGSHEQICSSQPLHFELAESAKIGDFETPQEGAAAARYENEDKGANRLVLIEHGQDRFLDEATGA